MFSNSSAPLRFFSSRTSPLVLVSGLARKYAVSMTKWPEAHVHIPSNGVVKWFACVGVPHHCCLALICDADSLDVGDLVALIQENVCSFINTLLY